MFKNARISLVKLGARRANCGKFLDNRFGSLNLNLKLSKDTVGKLEEVFLCL